MGPPDTEKFLYNKGHVKQDKIAAGRKGKGLYQVHIGQRTDLQNIQRTQKIGHQKTN